MLRTLKISLFALAAVALLASCQNANSAIKDAARQSLESDPNAQVQPNNSIQSAIQSPDVPTGPTTEMTFKEQTFDFGTAIEGEKVSHTYSFTNTGDEPLILSNARGSCGCTVPKWPRQPIKPGDSGEIVVEFNTQNKVGKRNQRVTITANTNPPETVINLNGTVEAKAAEPDVSVN